LSAVDATAAGEKILMVDVPLGPTGVIAAPDVEDVELYHPHSWLTKYVFSQDAKVIAIQYSFVALTVGLIALVLSWLMRLQLGFPGVFSFIDAKIGRAHV
jgi:cytochrome c oxidase subunit 1